MKWSLMNVGGGQHVTAAAATFIHPPTRYYYYYAFSCVSLRLPPRINVVCVILWGRKLLFLPHFCTQIITVLHVAVIRTYEYDDLLLDVVEYSTVIPV